MRVIPFGPPRLSEADARALAQIEAALDGDATGSEADYWRELRADVRSLSEPVDPAFADALRRRVRAPGRPDRSPRGLGAAVAHRRGLALGLAGSLVAVLVAVLVVASHTSSRTPQAALPTVVHQANGKRAEEAVNGLGTSGAAAGNGPIRGVRAAPAIKGLPVPSSAAAGGEAPGEAGVRLQHLGAAISLGGGSEGVQQVADRVGRTTVAAGGFVESSRVQTQQGSVGEALLTLVLPSAKLQTTLSELERIAPVRAETQSLQDITAEYHAAVARLAAARDERAALLRALAHADTPAAVESLHARLAGASHQITAAEHRQAGVSRQASQAQVEVTVFGEPHHAGGGSTLARGLHDAGKVLTVSLAALIVAAAVLVPLGLLLAAVVTGGRFWRRQRRERVLGSG